MIKKETITCEFLINNQQCQSVNEPEVKGVRTDFCKNHMKDQCCYLCEQQKDCEISCSYLEGTPKKADKANESEVEIDDGPPILETKWAALTKSYLEYDAKLFKIADMAKASIAGGSWKAPSLLIDFKDGTQKKFDVWSIAKESHANLFFTGGSVQTLTKDQTSSTQQWVMMINLLIGLQMK
jgi:hypothetical protein